MTSNLLYSPSPLATTTAPLQRRRKNLTAKHTLQLLFTHITPSFNSQYSKRTEESWYQNGKQVAELKTCKVPIHQITTIRIPTLKSFTAWIFFLPPNQQCQSTEGKITAYNTSQIFSYANTRC